MDGWLDEWSSVFLGRWGFGGVGVRDYQQEERGKQEKKKT